MNPSGENLIELASDTRSVGTKIYADSAVSLGQKMAPLLYYQGGMGSAVLTRMLGYAKAWPLRSRKRRPLN